MLVRPPTPERRLPSSPVIRIAAVDSGSHTQPPWLPRVGFLKGAGPDDLFLGGPLHYHPQFTPCEVAQLEPSVHGLLIVLPAVYLLERRLS
jgi:hypothetical protein